MDCDRKYRWARPLSSVTGILALIWFRGRVVTKPPRAMYPCERVTVPFANSFIVGLTSMIRSTLAYWKARLLLCQFL